MRLVLDASVVVTAFQPEAPGHDRARRRVQRALTGADELVLPAIFITEVGAALGRLLATDYRVVIDQLTTPPHEVVSLSSRRARAAMELAVAARLRGADATYAALAVEERLPLCTLDATLARGAARFCKIARP